VSLRYRAPTPQLSVQVLSAVIDSYKARSTSDRTGQATLAISFYESRVQAAEEKLQESTEALRGYIAGNPRLADTSRGGTAASAAIADPQLTEFQRRVEADQREAERTRAALEKARFDVEASLEGQDLGFPVVDPPRAPTSSSRDLRKMLIFPIAGMLGGVAISAMLLVLLIAGDRTIRSEAELASTGRVLGMVRHLRVKRIPRKARADATRRAIGFVAGAALPVFGKAK
jgi:uncharacterized protein involved in exopolysaccharide biosynthesis